MSLITYGVKGTPVNNEVTPTHFVWVPGANNDPPRLTMTTYVRGKHIYDTTKHTCKDMEALLETDINAYNELEAGIHEGLKQAPSVVVQTITSEILIQFDKPITRKQACDVALFVAIAGGFLKESDVGSMPKGLCALIGKEKILTG